MTQVPFKILQLAIVKVLQIIQQEDGRRELDLKVKVEFMKSHKPKHGDSTCADLFHLQESVFLSAFKFAWKTHLLCIFHYYKKHSCVFFWIIINPFLTRLVPLIFKISLYKIDYFYWCLSWINLRHNRAHLKICSTAHKQHRTKCHILQI